MKNLFEKILKLAETRVNLHIKLEKKTWEKKYSIDVYKKWLIWEIDEAFNEIKKDNSVYLEDELWDIFRTYTVLLQGLQKEWYITDISKVFERSYEKFSWRLDYIIKNDHPNSWKEIKNIQKIEREKEHNTKYLK
jgi:NTP pyrophosphatase (non-canonical NTP hydrolase)